MLWYILHFLFRNAGTKESWLSGRKRLTANEVSPLNGFAGSNPALSARQKHPLGAFAMRRVARAGGTGGGI
ncbi:MAG: hypothetical protein RLZZ234_170 [Candidatus Parcubacteria bacterium]